MSLNGLDAPELKEAYQAALKEGGGWFLLQYKSRDEVDLLGKGSGGIGEIQEAIDLYEEESPLFGFIHYRRRKVVLKYIPDGTSRLLQARLSVHFQSVTEWLDPFDTVFAFTKSSELSDSSLLPSLSLHAAALSKSSNDPNALRGLAGISEDALEGGPVVRNAGEEVEQTGRRSRENLSTRADERAADLAANQSASRTSKPIHQRSRTLSNTDKQLPASPGVALERSGKSSTYDHEDTGPRPSVEMRLSSQSERPHIRDLNRAYESKPKIKLGPRPSMDSTTRQETTSMGRDPYRPKATLPTGLRMSTRKPFAEHFKVPSIQKLPIERTKETPAQVTSASVPLPVRGLLPESHLSAPNSDPNLAVTSPTQKPPRLTPEKRRLMKALQIRQRHMEARDVAKGLGISMGREEPTLSALNEANSNSKVQRPSSATDSSERARTGPEKHVNAAHDVLDSPSSLQGTSEGPSTQASSINDDEVPTIHKEASPADTVMSKEITDLGTRTDTNRDQLVDKTPTEARGSLEEVIEDHASEQKDVQAVDSGQESTLSSSVDELGGGKSRPLLQESQRLSLRSSSTVDTIVRHSQVFSDPMGPSVSSGSPSRSEKEAKVSDSMVNSLPKSESRGLSDFEDPGDESLTHGAQATSYVPKVTTSEQTKTAQIPHPAINGAAVTPTRSQALEKDVSEKPETRSDSMPPSKASEDLNKDSPSPSLMANATLVENAIPRSGLNKAAIVLDIPSIPHDVLQPTDRAASQDAENEVHTNEVKDPIEAFKPGSDISESRNGQELEKETDLGQNQSQPLSMSFLLPKSASASSEELDESVESESARTPLGTEIGQDEKASVYLTSDPTVIVHDAEISCGSLPTSELLNSSNPKNEEADVSSERSWPGGTSQSMYSSLAERSEEQLLSDDSFMEELKSAKLQEAKPISVSKSPIKPVFSRSESDGRVWDPSKASRSVSSPFEERGIGELSSSSPPRPAPLTIRSFSNLNQPRLEPQIPPTSQILEAKKVGVSSGISQRIKALEKLSSRPNSPITPNSSTPSFLNFPKSSFRSASGSPDLSGAFVSKNRPSTANSPVSSPESNKPNPFSQPLKGSSESISVTATIIKDSRPDESEPLDQTLHQSPLRVERQSKEVATQQVMGPPPTPRSPIRFSRPKYSRYSSARSIDSTSTEHKGEVHQATRRSSFASKRSASSRNGSDIDLTQSTSDKSTNSNNVNGGNDDRRESRGSRLLKRMSSVTSASRRSIAHAISPSRKTESIIEHREPDATPAAPATVDLGDVNVQFPDTLLWKRRHLVIDESGNLSLTASLFEKRAKVTTKHYALSEFRKPYIPEQDREELPNSVVLDFNDGSTLQCACEHARGQAHLLKVLIQLHAVHCRN